MPVVTQVLTDIVMPPELLSGVVKELRQRHGRQQDYVKQSISAARLEYDKVTKRLKALTYERLDGNIPDDLYKSMVQELTDRQHELNAQMENVTDSNHDFLITASHLLDLCQRAVSLFNSAPEDLQQKLLKTVLSNLVIDMKSLSYEVNQPFKAVIEMKKQAHNEPENGLWCGSGDSNPWPHPWQGCALNN